MFTQYVAYKDEKSIQLLRYLRDESIPKAERLAMWMEAPLELLVEEPYILTLKCAKLYKGGDICWYDDLYVDKYQLVDMRDIYERILDVDEDHSKEFIEAFEDEMLETGLGSFTNDW